ncbi:MAG: DUF3179 domain-containing protein [Lautropia sp.]|nr:DUF3179 domain-containing protein [Lautropia sp.]
MPAVLTRSPAIRSILRSILRRAFLFAAGLTFAGGLTASLAFAAGPDPRDFNGFDVSNSAIPTAAIQRGGPPRDGIPAIDHPKFVAAGEARLADSDRVLGLTHDGEARAYPVRILNWHEVVNDRLGDRAVAVTYCPLCGTGMAFDARVDQGGQGGKSIASFGVSGLLYNSDVLLYDRATQSLWSQILRTAISGPLKGSRLDPVPLTHTSWADWRRRHPATRVLSTDTGFARDYSRDPYAGYERIQRLMFDVQHRDDRFPLKEWVLGVEVDGVHKAYPFSLLARAVGSGGELQDTVAGRSLRIRYDHAQRTAEAFDAEGRPWPATMAFWFAWIAFHPHTEVLRDP